MQRRGTGKNPGRIIGYSNILPQHFSYPLRTRHDCSSSGFPRRCFTINTFNAPSVNIGSTKKLPIPICHQSIPILPINPLCHFFLLPKIIFFHTSHLSVKGLAMKQKTRDSGKRKKLHGVSEPLAEYRAETGTVITVDATGRMVLPKKIRDHYHANRFEVKEVEGHIESDSGQTAQLAPGHPSRSGYRSNLSRP